ncbi:MAG: ribonucleoside hydrolase RihC [Bifidobacterium scardovii]|uniref:ribonucleoside hydrolase RihC n=1 Tax=Bifidobacterium scardovii TaxID=158787 RepID=UPI000668BB17|nr:ribonucleoside hydrolase RihC [Bifidobacterium scardovii]MBS6948455.1 ribonucleoside hydrolase RihC [Bifidobacterium scardovii]MDU3737722.1 ribonucleoside hydrolase RihC [Bifidobacterium scardovii]MDU5297498.1 ribonucleoside hydrolase RihC [Bifidobacterium scardovii]MDU5609801.1 ribonucleoside hydrolase RihC [Bifidobacterium scardovii]MDU5886600.1 ribonucleoside hydrolase RihC [Bifidobacterium scardovii]
MKRIPLIIDTDPGIDDAVAIALALYSDDIDVRLITTVSGNVGIEATTTNALKLLAYFGKDVPVARGASEPLIRAAQDASDIHGATGMEGFDFPEPKRELLMERNAIDAMRDVLMKSEEPITIMPIGPLTNIALLLKAYPEVKARIERIVLMGGSVTRGNKGVMAEFNIYVDPEAAKIVLASGVPIVMATLDAGLGTAIPPEKTAQLKDMGKVGLMAHDLFQRYRKRSFGTGLKMYDACAVACLLKPDLFDMADAFVDVETAGELTAGCTVVDLKGYLKREPNATVTTGVDSDRFCDWFMEGIGHCA